MGNFNKGFVAMPRSLLDTPLKSNLNYLGMYTYLILKANYYDNTEIRGNTAIEIKRGQRLTSIKKLSKQFGYSRKTIARMLDLLEELDLCTSKRTNKYTIITINRYDELVGTHIKVPSKSHQSPIKVPQINNNNNNKPYISVNLNQELGGEYIQTLKQRYPTLDVDKQLVKIQTWLKENNKVYKNYKLFANNWLKRKDKDVDDDEEIRNQFKEFVSWFNKTVGTRYKPISSRLVQFKDRVSRDEDPYTVEQIKEAVKRAKKSKFMMGDNDDNVRYLTLEYMLRAEKIEKWLNAKPREERPTHMRGKMSV